ncbi:DUF3834 domain-containing protein [Sulfolobus sp. E5-1-F]|uniref:DUF3834 domain-containing protein n=1 Tax=Saccharolobus sp. E5-1-F TaxID=2663019 RepID=UPI0012980190|nr:DUF3834 domain-containing protein [Sulfolobus sp. E5-1-F]QGA54152.1 DUF3834 domain-containing protein [Sulfolobus sp. E5-1-F]
MKGISFSDYISRLCLLAPSCMIYLKPNVDADIAVEAYREGIEVFKNDPEKSAKNYLQIIGILSGDYHENNNLGNIIISLLRPGQN